MKMLKAKLYQIEQDKKRADIERNTARRATLPGAARSVIRLPALSNGQGSPDGVELAMFRL